MSNIALAKRQSELNSTEKNKTDCYPEDIINQKLSNSFMSNLYIDNDFKLDEINTPIKPFIKNMNSPISSTIFKNFFREISEVRIIQIRILYFLHLRK